MPGFAIIPAWTTQPGRQIQLTKITLLQC